MIRLSLGVVENQSPTTEQVTVAGNTSWASWVMGNKKMEGAR